MPKVSIIMPTYNVEKYFRKCLESVINQTLEDIEIIPVDDGSPDNCGKIMDEYALKDSRIKPIHKENGGYGSAVNLGIEKATGEYISILETDDFAEKNAYELLYNCAKKKDADMVKCSFYYHNSFNYIKDIKHTEDYKIIEEAPNKTFNILEYPKLMFFHCSVWAAIYKASFIKDIKFIEKEYYQDFPFYMEVLCKAKKIYVLKKHLIHYRLEEGQNSSTNRKDKKLLNMPKNVIIGKEILIKYGLFNKLKEYFYYHAFLTNYSFFDNIKLKYKRKYLTLLKQIFSELKNDNTFNYLYFKNWQKKFIKRIIYEPTFFIMISFYYKAIKRFFIYKYERDVYEVTRILGFIYITKKSERIIINNRINHLEYLLNKLDRKINRINNKLLNKNNKE
ncbi:glycosyltransferase family 2 protein [Brachyspira pulli]|uniref:glycosyltransferase family 2 protein n=1 Tax=Brachyspira pulli TaxID=310721 RepID=UPI00300419D7